MDCEWPKSLRLWILVAMVQQVLRATQPLPWKLFFRQTSPGQFLFRLADVHLLFVWQTVFTKPSFVMWPAFLTNASCQSKQLRKHIHNYTTNRVLQAKRYSSFVQFLSLAVMWENFVEYLIVDDLSTIIVCCSVMGK